MKIEIAPSGRSKCHKCKNLIPIGSKRLKVTGGLIMGKFLQKFILCKDCGNKKLQDLLDKLNS